MSEIRVTTVSDTAGTGPVTLTKQQAAKAWINLNGTSTVAIRDSFNVASIADEGTGAYQTNFSSNMGNVNYAVSGSSGDGGSASGCWHTTGFNANSYNTSNLVSSFHQQIYYQTSTTADVSFVYAAVQGDLA